jgi:quercetin dioxygenase-like cupin family protein
MKPYVEKRLNESTLIRLFSSITQEADLKWHRDRQDRIIEVIHSNGWLFQRDDSVPALLSSGDILEIAANEWHRVIKGEGELIVKITEAKKKKLTKKQKKIAQAAPPPDEITGADFKALNKNVDEANPRQYGAPKGSKRAEELEDASDL